MLRNGEKTDIMNKIYIYSNPRNEKM